MAHHAVQPFQPRRARSSEIVEAFMHFRFRWTIVLAAIVVFCGGCGQMQKVHPRENDLLFQQAWKLEDAGNKQGALDELKRVADQQTANPEAAAKALYQAGLLASERLSKSDEDKLSAWQQGAAIWQDLADKYPKTEAAKQILQEE